MKAETASEPCLPTTEGKKYLPQPMGPHSVGYADFTTTGKSGLFTRVYYPTNLQCLDHHDKWPLWSEDEYICGLLSFIQASLSCWPSWAPRDDYKYIDKIQYISPYIPKVGFPKLFRYLTGNAYIPIIKKAELSRRKKWPVLVFSHGLGCAAFMYSRICYDIASFGFIVAAVEHRDGSACFTPSIIDDTQNCSSNKFESLNLSGIHYRRLDAKDDEYQIRNDQVKYRAREVSRTLDFLLALNRGKVTSDKVMMFKNRVSSEDLKFLQSFSGSLDESKLSVAGHSFGGATALLSLAKDDRFKTGTILDGWFFPIKNEKEDLFEKISQPTLFINNESFTSPENIKMLSKILQKNPNHKSFCIKGSVHQNHLDSPILMKDTLIKQILGMHSSVCPETFLSLNNRLLLHFAIRNLKLEKDSEIEQEIARKKSLLMCFDFKTHSYLSEANCQCSLHKGL